ncbi:hypothetical protein ACWGVU_32395, partial [Embleya sp. NPDC055610]
MDEDDPATPARIATVLDVGAHYPDLTVREHQMPVAVAHGLGRDADDPRNRSTCRVRRLGRTGVSASPRRSPCGRSTRRGVAPGRTR